MHRRQFTKNLLMTGLAVPSLLAGTTAAAFGHDGDRGHGPECYGRVALHLSGKRRLINYFAIPTDKGPYGVDLRMEVPQMAAERIDLGMVPLLRQILTPTLPRQFAGATPVGSLHLVNDALVLLPEIVLPRARIHAWITHRKVVYQPPASIHPLALKTPLAREYAAAAPHVGKAVLKNNTILAIVSPSALDDMDFVPSASA